MKEETDGAGVDVILDNMGAKYLARNVDALAVGGRLVTIGMQGGTKAELDLGKLWPSARRCTRRRCAAARPPATAARPRSSPPSCTTCGRTSSAGSIRPIVDRRLPMSRAAEAHRLVEASEHIGKVLLLPED